MMDYIIFALIFAFILVITFPNELLYRKKKIKNLFYTENFKTENKHESLNKNKYQSLISIGELLGKLIKIRLPRKITNMYEQRLMHSNLVKKVTLIEFLYIKLAVSLLIGSFFIIIFLSDLNSFTVVIILLLTILGYFAPDNILTQKSVQFQKDLNIQIPMVFSSLSIVTDAGLNVRQGLREITKDQKGALIDLITVLNKRISLGANFIDEVNLLIEHSQSQELNQFTALLIQAETKGAEGYAQGLRDLTHLSWELRKNNASILAEKASVKLFLPMALLVFPAIIIVMVGPLIFSIMEMFN